MDQELKPCPFCGAKAEIKEYYDSWDKIDGYKVGCSNKDCFCYSGVDYISFKNDAIKRWNQRIEK